MTTQDAYKAINGTAGWPKKRACKNCRRLNECLKGADPRVVGHCKKYEQKDPDVAQSTPAQGAKEPMMF